MAATGSSEPLVDALLAIAAGDLAAALACCDAAPQSPLSVELGTYLRAQASGDVYTGTEALTRFIDGGSNRALYDALHRRVANDNAATRPVSLLDLGCGDGRVAVAACVESVRSVDLVEPSAALLELAVSNVADDGRTVRAHTSTAQTFTEALDADDGWDVAQSTFALHTLPPAERDAVLRSLQPHVGHLVLAEFDVPSFADRSVEHARYVVGRYERGLREYDGDAVVAQGFLMPVLVGQFDPAAARHTFEQPGEAWAVQLRHAGFTDVRVSPLADYWWANAVLVEGRGGRGGAAPS